MWSWLCLLWHRIEHRYGWNQGDVVTWWDEQGQLLVGFCCECGKLLHARVIDIKPAPKDR
jgi:hypothetical protein